MPVTIELYPHEVTVILEALSARPYMEVAALIKKIVHQQAEQESK